MRCRGTMNANRCREGGTMSAPWDFRVSLLLLVGVLTRTSVGQESSANPAPNSSATRSDSRASLNSGAATLPVPDAVKFANGLLRQRKYDLAAEEFERILKS